MREFPNEAVLEQISAPQPGILLWCFLFAVPMWGPTSLTQGLMLWPMFVRAVKEYQTVYLLSFFVAQMALICGSIAFLSSHYVSAFWIPRPRSWRSSLGSVWIVLPVFLFNLGNCFGAWQIMLLGRSFRSAGPGEFDQIFSSIYQNTWSGLAYGSTITGVVCDSVLSFVSPVLEEILFSGLLANWLAKRIGISGAVLITPICFSLVHGVQFGFGSQLIPLFFAGLSYTLMRFYSGNVLMSVFGHIAVNFVVLLPKWIIAAMHFGHP